MKNDQVCENSELMQIKINLNQIDNIINNFTCDDEKLKKIQNNLKEIFETKTSFEKYSSNEIEEKINKAILEYFEIIETILKLHFRGENEKYCIRYKNNDLNDSNFENNVKKLEKLFSYNLDDSVQNNNNYIAIYKRFYNKLLADSVKKRYNLKNKCFSYDKYVIYILILYLL